MDEKGMQENVLIYQILQKHLEELGQSALLLDRRYAEIEAAREAFEDIAGLKEKNEVLIPIGSGIFSYGKITDAKKVLVEVGAGVLMDKEPESARKFLEEKKQEIEKLAGELQAEINGTSEKMNAIASELEKAALNEGAKRLQPSHASNQPGKKPRSG